MLEAKFDEDRLGNIEGRLDLRNKKEHKLNSLVPFVAVKTVRKRHLKFSSGKSCYEIIR